MATHWVNDYHQSMRLQLRVWIVLYAWIWYQNSALQSARFFERSQWCYHYTSCDTVLTLLQQAMVFSSTSTPAQAHVQMDIMRSKQETILAANEVRKRMTLFSGAAVKAEVPLASTCQCLLVVSEYHFVSKQKPPQKPGKECKSLSLLFLPLHRCAKNA